MLKRNYLNIIIQLYNYTIIQLYNNTNDIYYSGCSKYLNSLYY